VGGSRLSGRRNRYRAVREGAMCLWGQEKPTHVIKPAWRAGRTRAFGVLEAKTRPVMLGVCICISMFVYKLH
jgi:hypothetical protein